MKISAVTTLLRQLGPLRLMLLTLAVAVAILAPPADTPLNYAGWGLVLTVLVPVIAPIVFMVLLLDALMARVFMAETESSERQRLKAILILNLVVAAGLLLIFLRYYLALGPD